MFFPLFDPTIVILVPGIIISLWAQMRVKSTFNKYLRVQSSSGTTGMEAAKRLLHLNGIHDVAVEIIHHDLGDHYDPRKKVLRLSPKVYGGSSLAALGVAAHEAGHAIQHHRGYFPLLVRNSFAPVASFGSQAAFPLLIIGWLMGSPSLAYFGVYLFGAVVLFQLVTLPVEFNASSRALSLLPKSGLISTHEAEAARKVLNAAALTYVAALIVGVLTLLRLLLITGMMGGRNE